MKNIDPSIQLALFRSMLRIRRVEEEIARRYSEQEMRCPTHLCIGQEAVSAGVSAHLRVDDLVYSGHRSHGHYLAKGGDLRAMIAELYLRETGCAHGRGGSQHLIDLAAGFVASAPILAGTIPIATGGAWGLKRAGGDQIAVVYFGDGAFEEGSCHEAMNFAVLRQLPIVFVCENNRYSVHAKLNVRQPMRPMTDIAKAHGMLAINANGNDVEEVWVVAGQAVQHARSGNGPVFIEFATDRWMEHCGPNTDYDLGYRAMAEIERAHAACPIAAIEKTMIENGLYTSEMREIDVAKIQAEIESAFDFARASPFPSAADLALFIYPEQ